MIAAVVAAAAIGWEPQEPRLLAATAGAIVRVDPDQGGRRALVRGSEAAWSRDGTQVVFVRAADLWTANADGSGIRRIVGTPNVAESDPAWSPDGTAIAYTATVHGLRQVRIVPALGGVTHRLAPSAAQAWSPSFSRDPGKLAFLARGPTGSFEIDVVLLGGSRFAGQPLSDEQIGVPVSDAHDLSWSRDGSYFAYTAVSDSGSAVVVDENGGDVVFHSISPSSDEHPVWSPDGRELAFDTLTADGVRDLQVMNFSTRATRRLGTGAALDWRVVPLGEARLPDLAQRPPAGLVVSSSHSRWLLGFTSFVDNRGAGPLWIRARRRDQAQVMRAEQLMQVSGGGIRTVADAGELRYTIAPPHYHWHLQHFDRYELRRASDFALVVRDRKSGFCLADHYGTAPGIPHGPPRFLGDCGQFKPQLRFVEEGSSVGYTDRYPADFHGQHLDITTIPAGRYWLVHRVNGDFALRESRYDNDAASVLISISWPGGRRQPPVLSRLRVCLRERC